MRWLKRLRAFFRKRRPKILWRLKSANCVIASGGSDTQVKALSDAVEEGLSALGEEPRRIEGYQSGMWIVLDYYDVIVHIFHEQAREFYGLERLWADAPRVELAPG